MKLDELLVVVAAAVGCTTHASEPDFDSPIGVERLTVEESDSTLAITGYAANGDLIARIALRTGKFYFVELEREVEGRQLRVESWMGHKRIDETMLYVHVAEAHRRELPEAVRLAVGNGTDPDTPILKMLGARGSHVAADERVGLLGIDGRERYHVELPHA
ncbi:MAG: hypothetical protein ABIY55_15245 [Kofleriaceae bacterium]